MQTALVTDPDFQHHLTGVGHPESPLRWQAISLALQELLLFRVAPRMAQPEELLLCHTAGYIQLVEQEIALCRESNLNDGGISLSTGDVRICPQSYRIALKAVGAVLTAVDLVVENRVKNAFCLVRPPGHHACSDKGMGFCLFNNIAVGARYLQNKFGVEKVLIVDWDLHHGNGTQEIFYADPSVFYFSTHQEPLYPGTGLRSERGAGPGIGTTLNCPVSAGVGSREIILRAFREQLVPAMERFRPDFVFLSAGFDAHIRDPLGGLDLRDEDFGALTDIVRDIAASYAKGRLVSVLEGGYDLQALASAGRTHLMHLME